MLPQSYTCQDPLEWLLENYPFDTGIIKDIIPGEKYLLVCLHNGCMGVCAKLGSQHLVDYRGIHTINREIIQHRMLALAFYSALFNRDAEAAFEGDVFDYPWNWAQSKIVMIGFFRPLVQKFDAAGIPVTIFDLLETDDRLKPAHLLPQYLVDADFAIITATTLVNNTFHSIIRKLSRDTKAILLGPSSVLHPFWFTRYPVKAVFGMQFKPYDPAVIKLIEAGEGTPAFSPFARKIAIMPENNLFHK